VADADRVKEEVKEALIEAIRKEGLALKVREGFGDRLDLLSAGKNVASDTLASVIEKETNRELCNRGFWPSITCKEKKDDRMVWLLRIDGQTFMIGLSYNF
jgi:hypothetical protein